MKKTLLSVFLGTIFLIVTTAALTDDIPETICFTAKNGDVTFPHKMHQDAGYDCQKCHHTLANPTDVPEQGCRECHNDEHKVKPMKAFHNTCKNCHTEYVKEHADSKAPTKCKECHVKS